jgi:hypothetical protein
MSAETKPAGREMDALVAERVLGWAWKRDQSFYVATREPAGPPYRFLIPPGSMFLTLDDAHGDEEIRMGGEGEHRGPPPLSTDIAAASADGISASATWRLRRACSGGLLSGMRNRERRKMRSRRPRRTQSASLPCRRSAPPRPETRTRE